MIKEIILDILSKKDINIVAQKIESLFTTLLEDSSISFDVKEMLILFLLVDKFNISVNNSLIQLEKEEIQLRIIRNFLNEKEKDDNNCCVNGESFFPDLFQKDKRTNRLRAKDQSVWSETDEYPADFYIKDETGLLWRFSVDYQGYLVDYETRGKFDDADINYDKIYAELKRDVLDHRDGSSQL